MADKLRALVSKWREDAEHNRQMSLKYDDTPYVREAGIRSGWANQADVCADELEAALDEVEAAKCRQIGAIPQKGGNR